MGGWYPVVLACLGRYCLLAPLDSFFQRWFVPGLPLECLVLRSFGIIVPLGHDSTW